MPEYLVFCKKCGGVSGGNSKWIPYDVVLKAKQDCRHCGSSKTKIKPGFIIRD